jgi:chorismate mutase/prephenate dehydratase
MPVDPLRGLRRRVDDLDARLVDILQERARLVVEIGAHKRSVGAPTCAPARERRVLSRAAARVPGPLQPRELQAVVREVIHGARKLQGLHEVAVLGPEGSHSEASARDYLGSSVRLRTCDDFDTIVDLVARAEVDGAIVPADNSVTGPIAPAREAVARRLERVRLRERFAARIEHALVGHGTLDRIDTVVSHPEVFRQCAGWLDLYLPLARREPATSSSAAIDRLAQAGDTWAAIGAARAARTRDVPVLVPSLVPATITRFWVLVPA